LVFLREGYSKGNSKDTAGGTNNKEGSNKEGIKEDGEYAFEGTVIKLNQGDYDRFKLNCPKLSDKQYRLELSNADLAYSKGDSNNWFFRLANYLRNAKPDKIEQASPHTLEDIERAMNG